MIRHHISHMDEETKKKNTELYTKIQSFGRFLKSEWNGDYLVATYRYNDKIWELWDNMEYGIMSEAIEYEQKEREL